jgi:Histidine-specific methyltransferase, SAM-dependent
MKKENTVFGPDHAVLNLSRIGLRYFRMGIQVNKKDMQELISKFSQHPNVGFVFQAEGWFNLAIGFWARDNAEIDSISDSIRVLLYKKATIIFQSELTALYSFGNRPMGIDSLAMTIVEPQASTYDLSPLEIDYIKLVTLNSEESDESLARVLSITIENLIEVKENLYKVRVLSGTQKRVNYAGTYYKIFIDTASNKTQKQSKELLEEIWLDTSCIYFAKTNNKYNLELELVCNTKAEIIKYTKHFSDIKIVTLTKNLYTNLYPVNKVANIKEIQENIALQTGTCIDLSNSKLWYLNYSSAQAYLDIYENKDYYEVMEKDELALFDQVISDIVAKYPEHTFNIVDIGAGNGLKAKYFIDILGSSKVKTYYPVDIQPVELAAAKLVHADSNYNVKEIVLDLEKFDTRFPIEEVPNVKTIYMFLGGTYGNFKSSDINSYLKSLNDILLVTMPIVIENSTKEGIIASYTNQTVENMMFGLLEQLGFNKKDFVFNPLDSDLIVHASMSADSRLVTHFYLKNEVIVADRIYEEGTQFKVSTSWKPTLSQFKEALEADFIVEKIYKNQKMSIAMIEK